MSIKKNQRFNKAHSCPICGGYDQAPRGKGVRCFGFLSEDGSFAHCTRAEHAGDLPLNSQSQTYAHQLTGDCPCGTRHNPAKPPPRERREIVAVYDYGDFEVVRFQPKGFLQRRKDGQWGLGDVQPHLYHREEVVAAGSEDTIYIPEGEKDVDRFWSLGLVSTTNPMGAGKWRDEYSRDLAGHHVAILPDNDHDGHSHAQQVAQSVAPLAASTRVIELPGLPEKGDVSDWLDQGHTLGELESLVAATPLWELPPPSGPFPEEEAITPDLPETVWRGLFDDYRRLVGPTTEAPDTYHFWTFAAVLGATIGRRAYVEHAVHLYPNFFIVLVGATGLARKDTAVSRGIRLLLDLHRQDAEVEAPRFEYLPGIGSAEGLLEALGGKRKVVVLRDSEFLNLLAKARSEGAGNLLPQLTALYDSPELHTLRTRTKPVRCEEPFLTIISASTPTWLRKALTEHDILGGFGNRWVYVPGTPKAPMAYPPPMDREQYAELLVHVNDVRLFADSLGEGQVIPTEGAKAVFSQWYAAYYQRAAQEGILPALSVRFQSVAWKLALLYSLQDF